MFCVCVCVCVHVRGRVRVYVCVGSSVSHAKSGIGRPLHALSKPVSIYAPSFAWVILYYSAIYAVVSPSYLVP